MRVFISVGHDKKRKGAKCDIINEYEYDLLIPLTDYLFDELTSRGIDARKVNSDKLGAAVKEINKECNKNDIALETHFNKFSNASVKGCETLFYKGSTRGENLADSIQNSLLAYLGVHDRGLLARDNLAFLKQVKCTSIITEPFFLSNEEEVKRFLVNDRDTNLKNIAFAIANGIHSFIKRED